MKHFIINFLIKTITFLKVRKLKFIPYSILLYPSFAEEFIFFNGETQLEDFSKPKNLF